MKTHIGKSVVLAIGVLTIGAMAGRAQITNQLEFKMSQSFSVADTTLAPGSYVIKPVPGDQGEIEISGVSGKPSVFVATDSVQPDATEGGSHLVFNKYQHVLALSQIFPGGGNQGYQLLQGRPEKQAAKTEKPTKQTVTGTSK
jgi:hypothetical protein